MPYDVFISYAHLDNLPDNKGWVTEFHRRLEIYLTEHLGRPAQIWREAKRISEASIIPPTLFEAIDQSLILLAITSPSYIVSEWCRAERDYFSSKVGTTVDNYSRVFRVEKLPLNRLALPPVFQDSTGFKFFQEEDGVTDKLSESAPEFDKAINRLAFRLKEVLDKIKAPQRKIVYLAETTRDLEEQRENIRKDLEQRNFKVLPNVRKPWDTKGYEESVREDLKSCTLAVHLIGRNYGDCPEDGDLSYIHLQTRVAAERDKTPDFSRLIWLPKQIVGKDEFMKELEQSAAANVDVYSDPSLENLKTRIDDILNGRSKSPPPPPAFRKYVYVFCDKGDKDSIGPVEEYLYDPLECEVYSASRNLENDDQGKFLSNHRQFLEYSHGVVIYWQNPNLQNWVRNTVQLLRRDFDDQSLAIYVALSSTLGS